MKLTHDEAYLYIGMELEEAFDPERSKLFIGADTIPGGDIPKKELAGRTLTGGALETLIQLGQEDESQVTIAPSYDFTAGCTAKRGIGCARRGSEGDQGRSCGVRRFVSCLEAGHQPADESARYPLLPSVCG